jgi:hypothetical protein
VAKDTYVITNNHFLGKAVVNAIEIASLVKSELVPAPAVLVERYPELRAFTAPVPESDAPGQLPLLS